MSNLVDIFIRAVLIENLALRQQLAVYTRQARRPQLRNADRRFWSLLARSWAEWRSTLVVGRQY